MIVLTEEQILFAKRKRFDALCKWYAIRSYGDAIPAYFTKYFSVIG